MAQVNMPKSSIGLQPAAEPQKKFQKVVKGLVLLAAVIFDVVSKKNKS